MHKPRKMLGDWEAPYVQSLFGEIYQSAYPSGRVAQKIRNNGSRVPEQWLNLLWIIHILGLSESLGMSGFDKAYHLLSICQCLA